MHKLICSLFIIISISINAEINLLMGSCNNQNRSQDYFKLVHFLGPDAWIWLGDNIYADHFSYEKRREAYEKVKFNPYYQDLSYSSQVYGIWDDHDYAYDNADGSYPYKEESKLLLMEFLDVPRSDEVFSREGIYRKASFDDGEVKVDLILMDTRSFYNAKEKKLLGETQWKWLEGQLKSSKADVILMASGIAVLSNLSWKKGGFEGWNYFSKERKRLMKLIKKTPQQVILLSGDRHSSDISRKRIGKGRRVYELMASGLTHSVKLWLPNRFRWGKSVRKVNFAGIKVKRLPSKEIKVNFHIYSAKNAQILEHKTFTF